MLLLWTSCLSATGTRTTILSSQVGLPPGCVPPSASPPRSPPGAARGLRPAANLSGQGTRHPPQHRGHLSPLLHRRWEELSLLWRLCLSIPCRGGGPHSLHPDWLLLHLQSRCGGSQCASGSAEGQRHDLPPSSARVEDSGHQQPRVRPPQ